MDQMKQLIEERNDIETKLDTLKETLADRHEELGKFSRDAYEDGDDEDWQYYRNKQEGVFECLRLVEKLILSNK